MKPTVFTIAGMHRSGTSLVANWFHSSGINIGNELYGAESSNVKGHFEDIGMLELHKSELRSLGYHESGLLINSGDLRFSKLGLKTASRIIEDKNVDIWGWKEPRTALYLNQWKQLIPELKVVGIYRNPDLVIDSLYKRLKRNRWFQTRNPWTKLKWFFDIDLNRKKWEKTFSRTYDIYNQCLLDFYEKYPGDMILLNLQDFVDQNSGLIERISGLLQIRESTFVPFYTVFDPQLIQTEHPNKASKTTISQRVFRELEKRRNS